MISLWRLESNSSNAIAWTSNNKGYLWKFQLLFNEIQTLATTTNVEFCHVLSSVNCMADAVVKQGVERTPPWEGFIM